MYLQQALAFRLKKNCFFFFLFLELKKASLYLHSLTETYSVSNSRLPNGVMVAHLVLVQLV